jgi:hypothetical protein
VRPQHSKKPANRKTSFAILFLIQLAVLVGTCAQARTPSEWIWSIASFIPAVVICLLFSEKKYVLPSLVILFVSQQAVFIFANPSWGFAFGSDQINDLHTAQLLSERAHFELGHLGYASRLSYSYYPMLHLFSVGLHYVSGLPLINVAEYFIPILNALLVTVALYYLNHDLFGLEGRTRNIATLLFQMSFVYTSFGSQFVRESFAFPFVLLSLWVATKIANNNDSRQGRIYTVLSIITFSVVVLSHQFSSFLLLVILAIMALSFRIFQRNNRLILPLLLMATVLGAYTAFVTPGFTADQFVFAFQGLQAIFNKGAPTSVMRPYDPWMLDLSLTQYAIISVLALIGGLKLLGQKRKNLVTITLLSFFVAAFLVCVALRLSTPADPWSYTYYMALRGTTWAFLGISIIAAIGMAYVFRLHNGGKKTFIALILVICILAAGKFSQYDPLVSNSSATPLTYPRYVASQWLKADTVHGSSMLVAPSIGNPDAFEGARSIAPYAYLKEYFLDEAKGRIYSKFSGYIPFIDDFYEQYRNLPTVDTIYSNGNTDIGCNYP